MNSLVIVLAVLGISNAQHWNNPNWAAGPAQQPGLPQDTPEVAAAKAAHYAALAKVQPQGQQPQAQWGQQPQARYQGPVALPPGFDQHGAPLPVQDTPEVAAERAKHFNLVGGFGAPPQQQWNAQPQQQWNAQPQQQWSAPQQQQWNAPPQQQWNAQPQQWNAQPQQQWNAQPQWNQNAPGLPQDTPEVAAAKAAHLAAHASHGRKRRSLVVAPYALTAHTALLPTAHLAAPALLAAHW